MFSRCSRIMWLPEICNGNSSVAVKSFTLRIWVMADENESLIRSRTSTCPTQELSRGLPRNSVAQT